MSFLGWLTGPSGDFVRPATRDTFAENDAAIRTAIVPIGGGLEGPPEGPYRYAAGTMREILEENAWRDLVRPSGKAGTNRPDACDLGRSVFESERPGSES